jgi:hypothetical protein
MNVRADRRSVSTLRPLCAGPDLPLQGRVLARLRRTCTTSPIRADEATTATSRKRAGRKRRDASPVRSPSATDTKSEASDVFAELLSIL